MGGGDREDPERGAFAWLGRIEHAGEILLGRHTPIVLGNFVFGPDCVLPTGGWARTFSPLSVFDFLKRSSLGYVTAGPYPGLAPTPASSRPTKASTATPTPSPRPATRRPAARAADGPD